MALLTAEDVLNKAFSKTKYREGFDQDEVDDFLDEVAHTISSLIAERDDLAQRLAQAQAGQPAAEAPAQGDNLLQAATDPTPPSATGMLAMAQKLHDEYVAAGEEERDRLIDEAKTKAESIVEQAETDAKSRMDDLATERSALESKIDDLRRFERDYRGRLKSYLENLLGDLDHGGDETPAAPAASSAAPAVAGGFGLASAAAAVNSAADAPAEEPVEESSDEVERPEPTPSPWAQVRDQSAASAVSAQESGEAEVPAWGASQYTPRLEPRDDVEQSNVARTFGADAEGEQH
ncbi:DivIVA domain-containing protein [Demequina sp. NBRC 110055]|uniref:DivIVA domain-containing protein n=1 Tax=Demequina sp. NBRC 110055 TaxID=1570344 RepID=UPI000A056B23|nr:DivIVA domain-containing protein [Demequina sp. NBRC 110055]